MAGSATLVTELSTKARLDARMQAARTRLGWRILRPAIGGKTPRPVIPAPVFPVMRDTHYHWPRSAAALVKRHDHRLHSRLPAGSQPHRRHRGPERVRPAPGAAAGTCVRHLRGMRWVGCGADRGRRGRVLRTGGSRAPAGAGGGVFGGGPPSWPFLLHPLGGLAHTPAA